MTSFINYDPRAAERLANLRERLALAENERRYQGAIWPAFAVFCSVCALVMILLGVVK